MVVKINIVADKFNVASEHTTENIKQGEVAMALLELEKIKQELLKIKFENFVIEKKDGG